jgi:branched-chain amino acid transport system substrate-binding protein
MARRLLKAGLLAVLLVSLLLVVACGGETTTETTAAPTETTAAPTETTAATTETTAGPATGEPIKIGLIASMSGTAAAPSPSMVNAVQLEVDAVNANGGVNGRPIELVIVDDKSDPATAASVATKLITSDKVTAILGPLSTPPCLAVQPLAEKYEVPLLRWDTPTLDAPELKEKWSFICSVGPYDVADALEKQIAAEGWKKIAAAADILPPNFQSLQLLQQDAASKGFEINYLQDTWQLDATDLTPQINKIFDAYKADNPDVLFVMSAITQTPLLQKGLLSLGVTVPIQSGPVSGHPAILAMGPEAVEGLLFLGAGITNPSQLPDTYQNKDLLIDFATRFKATYDEDATLFAGAGYDSFHILLEGLKAGGDDKAKVRDAIEALKDFPVSQGVVNYTPDDHVLHGGYSEWLVKSGVFTFVRQLN